MRIIAQGTTETERKPTQGHQQAKDRPTKDGTCKNCGKKGHSHKDCRGEPSCFYCKEKGHRRFDCPVLKKKEAKATPKLTGSTTVAATSESDEHQDSSTVAAVQEGSMQLVVDSPMVQVSVPEKELILMALLDTGSPVSFMKARIFDKFIKTNNIVLRKTDRILRNLSDQKLDVLGIISVKINFKVIEGKEFPVELHILKNDTFQGDIILGRKFFNENNLTLVYSPAKENAEEKVNLFTVLPLCVDEEQTNDLEQICKNNKVDFDTETKLKLEKLILEVNSQKVLPVDDDYKVEVNIKDPSVFAYAPRRFAMEERKQIRAITDDLLQRGIIRVSVSPYCARVVPVRKKDGRLRLCVDLRPLNSRVVKQKYPFPIVEECL
ncbi:blastopia polyprotein, partial [Lasius niger]